MAEIITAWKDGVCLELCEDKASYKVVNSDKEAREITIPSEYNGCPVTEIQFVAFYKNKKLRRLTIPSTVKRIDGSAFSDLDNLKEVNISDLAAWCDTDFGDNPLYYSEKLCVNGEPVTELKIPEGVKRISDRAFAGCKNLLRVELPSSVETIGVMAFEYCESLNSVSIPDSVTSIGKQAFRYCRGLGKINIPGNVENIESECFGGCTGVTELKIPDGVKRIGEAAFFGCTELLRLTLSDSVETVGKGAFRGCSRLKFVSLGENLKKIEPEAFLRCQSLTEIVNGSFLRIKAGNTDHGGIAMHAIDVRGHEDSFDTKSILSDESRAFDIDGFKFFSKDGKNYLIGYNGGGTSLTLPKDCRGARYEIKEGAFAGGAYLTLTVPDGVIKIGD